MATLKWIKFFRRKRKFRSGSVSCLGFAGSLLSNTGIFLFFIIFERLFGQRNEYNYIRVIGQAL